MRGCVIACVALLALFVAPVFVAPVFVAPAFAATAPGEGLYLGYSNDRNSNIQLEVFFFKPGIIVRNPPVNPDKNGIALLLARKPPNLGSYTMSGNVMRVVWGNGATVEGPVEPDPGGAPTFAWDSIIFIPIQGFKPDERFDGVFDARTQLSTTTVQAMRAQTIAFRRDGRFEMEIAIGLVDTFFHDPDFQADRGNLIAVNPESTTVKGRYRLDGTELRLTADDGKTNTFIICPITVYDGARGRPDHLFLDGRLMKRRD